MELHPDSTQSLCKLYANNANKRRIRTGWHKKGFGTGSGTRELYSAGSGFPEGERRQRNSGQKSKYGLCKEPAEQTHLLSQYWYTVMRIHKNLNKMVNVYVFTCDSREVNIVANSGQN